MKINEFSFQVTDEEMAAAIRTMLGKAEIETIEGLPLQYVSDCRSRPQDEPAGGWRITFRRNTTSA